MRAGAAMLLGLLACRPAPTRVPDRVEVEALLAAGGGSNVAATSDTAADPRLRARLLPLERPAADSAIRDAVGALPRWRVRGTEGDVVWATRTTRLFRFVDDVFLLLDAESGGTRIRARSASRIGRSDFGQNRRNLAELWDALEAAGARIAPPPP